jgi:hypothetical protein
VKRNPRVLPLLGVVLSGGLIVSMLTAVSLSSSSTAATVRRVVQVDLHL